MTLRNIDILQAKKCKFPSGALAFCSVIAITGFAKGSGMIRPDFATLLSFVFIDGKLNSNSLEKIHSNALSESFEALTVDGDTSPNDSSLLVATQSLF